MIDPLARFARDALPASSRRGTSGLYSPGPRHRDHEPELPPLLGWLQSIAIPPEPVRKVTLGPPPRTVPWELPPASIVVDDDRVVGADVA